MSQSLDNFIRDVIPKEGDVLASAHTLIAGVAGTMAGAGALPGHAVEGLIARGGMGVVYRARQEALERPVAVKVMTSAAQSPEMAERFRREALILGRLAHPNIVPVYDIGTDEDGQLFYTMKLVKGVTLQAIVQGLRTGDAEMLRQHSLASLLTVFRKVCDALAFAHSQGVLHRDLKPENIMVGEFGEVLVMDWGLAKVKAESGKLKAEMNAEVNAAQQPDSVSAFSFPISTFSGTLQGSVMGTPQYMSPEQAMGLVDELDERSDVFSLGGILYAILTLRPPVDGMSVDEILGKVKSGAITSPSLHGSTVSRAVPVAKGEVLPVSQPGPLPHIRGGRVPAALSAVAMQALALDKAKRYPGVAALSADIEAYQGGFATSAERAGALKQIQLLMLRHKAVTAALAAMIVLSIGFVIKVMASERRALTNEQIAVQEKESTRQALAHAQTALAESALRENDGLAAHAALLAVPVDLRDASWGYLTRRSDTSLATLHSKNTGTITGIAADRSRAGVFAIAGQDDWISIVEARTGKRLAAFRSGLGDMHGGAYLLSFSPDGAELAVANQSAPKIAFHHTSDGQKLREWAVTPPRDIEFSPVSRQVLVTPRNKGVKSNLCLRDADTGVVVWSLDPQTSWVRAAFAPQGGFVVAALGSKKVVLLNARDGSEVRRLPDSPSYVWQIVVSPDGELVAYGDEKGAVKCARLSDGQPVLDFNAQRTVRQMQFTPESRRLVTLTWPDNRSYHRLHVWDARSGRLRHAVLGADDAARLACIHPVSGEMIVAGETTKSWDLRQSEPQWTIPSCINEPWVSFCGNGDDTLLMFDPEGTPEVVKLGPQGAHTTLWRGGQVRAKNPLASASADGRHAIAGGYNSTRCALIQLAGGGVKELAQWPMPSPPRVLSLSPAGDRVWNGTQVLDALTGKELRPLAMKVAGRPTAARWITASRIVATFDDKMGSTLALADADSGETLRSVPHGSRILALAAAPGGRLIAEAGQDKIVRLRDAETLAVRQQFRAHDDAIVALAFHPGKPMLATVSDDFTLRLWNHQTGVMLQEIRGLEVMPVSIAWSPGGGSIATTGIDRKVSVWAVEEMTKSE